MNLRPVASLCRILLAGLAATVAVAVRAEDARVVDIGTRRQLFVDDTLIGQSQGTDLRLHQPIARETVLAFDAPWEGSGSDFERVIRDGDIIRMYYMACLLTTDGGTRIGRQDGGYACVVESRDGIHWVRPDLGLVEFQGSRHNNIVWTEPKLDNFTPFIDTNPQCPPEERYKAMALGSQRALCGFKSADGLRWTRISEKPLITHGKFDTQNNAFWDPVRRQYWCYIRGFHGPDGRDVEPTHHATTGIRDIRVATSSDFRTWTEPQRLKFPGSPDEALYTNQVEPYYRAPDLFVGFPTRYVDREFSAAALDALPSPAHRRNRMKFVPRYGTVITDGQFMTSHDGTSFHRWDESFIPPGPERSNNWLYGDGYQSLGLIETPAADPTAEPELSFYADEGHWMDGQTVRRYTLRIDGFASVHARKAGGEFTTRPLVFSGKKLALNFATAAAGSIWVEVRDAAGRPIAGFTRAACDTLFGDTLGRTVTWGGRSDVSALAGRPVRLRFVMSEADLYSLKFE